MDNPFGNPRSLIATRAAVERTFSGHWIQPPSVEALTFGCSLRDSRKRCRGADVPDLMPILRGSRSERRLDLTHCAKFGLVVSTSMIGRSIRLALAEERSP